MLKYDDIKNKIFCGNSKEVLQQFPSNSIDLVVTSPPYFNLRNYQHKDQIGAEQSPQEYITNLISIFRECKRVLKRTGSIWVNIADSYNDKKSLIGIPERFVISMQDQLGLIRRNTIIWQKPSCMPSSAEDRFTIDFEYFYFFVKSNETLLWKHRTTKEWTNRKPIIDFDNPKEENITWEWYEDYNGKKKKRSLWKSYDYFFETQYEPMQTESIQRYMRGIGENTKWGNDTNKKENGLGNHSLSSPRPNINKMFEYNGIAQKDYKGNGVQDPSATKKRILENMKKRKFGGSKETGKYASNQDSVTNKTYSGNAWNVNENFERIKRTVWSINTPNTTEQHFATYPEELIETPIKACTRKGDIVLDPFMGSGTTSIKAQKLARFYIGIDINPKYVSIARRRLNNMITSYINRF